MADVCPKCGATADTTPTWVPTYACGSNEEPFEDIGFRQSDECRINELSCENERLRTAVADGENWVRDLGAIIDDRDKELSELRLANAAWRSDHYIWIDDSYDCADAIEQPRVSIATEVLRRLLEIRGKNLACFCPLDKPCHADVLLELANGVNHGTR